MPKENQDITIYTIVYTAADADREKFINPEAKGSYLSLASAQAELERQIAVEKTELDSYYNCMERDGDSRERYQDVIALVDGYVACLSRGGSPDRHATSPVHPNVLLKQE